ncbi:unnamed protein product [Rotaria magnacalcarata]|uniref:Uncharacterized protein n=2 Tax=Rotaria magnacalcarata TaxID=392030 RepID=A0A814YQ39_9BILA|nr:unnamed protein product [Rotaria magnacalcarata]CAF1421779.1 unnamed protein product [Rotaria magnacalcarata]CAF2068695.1 unnamed protein product [Rotaria magnacalcarata]CAF4117801.1 unnamed protein product [Rotaria magnacalcarata]
MQDATPSPGALEQNGRSSRDSEGGHESASKPTTATTGKRRAGSRRASFRPDLTVSARATNRINRAYTYVAPASGRESWWRVTIKDTPNPGRYDTHLNTFVKEVLARPMTYGFKSDGRRRDPQPLEPKGKDLLPGAYSVEDFVEHMRQLRSTYGFKGPEREESLRKSMSANHDKDIDVAPGLYETQNYQTINVPIEAARHSVFKSKIRRNVFLPKLGPAPGDYEPQLDVINVNPRTVTSSFRSGTDRFFRKPDNVPGPGSYDRLTVFPTPKQIDSFSTRGVFFSANFARAGATAV